MTEPTIPSLSPLLPILYADIKAWLVSLSHKVQKHIRNTAIEKFDTLSTLIIAIKENQIQAGDPVRLKVTPAPFGPFLRNHFLTPIVGFHTSLRNGPLLISPNPIMGIMAQATSHLTPVGLYPPIGNDINQACLYPTDTHACGFIGLIPGVNELVPHLYALISSRHTPHYGIPCWITGIIRYIDASTLISSGYSPEDHEVIRQTGNVWFLDITGDEAKVEPIQQTIEEGLWGGLYASGHLEISDGTLKIETYVEAVNSALKSEGFETQISQNKAGRQEIAIYSKGIRATLDSKAPFYSVHMDAEVTRDFQTYRQVFDSVITKILNNFKDICTAEAIKIANELDLDFSYTDSTKSFSILKSSQANNIHDPIAIAIRDWHRLRGI